MAFFSTLGYSTTGHAGERSAARGVFEIDSFTPSYDLLYLGTGVAFRNTERGVLELLPTWTTSALGKMRVVEPDVAGMRWVFPLFTPAHFPPREVLRGRSSLGRGFGTNFVPTPLSVQLIRLSRPIPPHPDWMRGRSWLRHGFSEDILPPTYTPPRVLIAKPSVFPQERLRGWTRLGRGLAPNQNPPAYFVIRYIRPAEFPLEILRGRHRWLTPHKSRASIELALLAEFGISVTAELSFRTDLDITVAATYRVILRDVVTDVEMVLGEGTNILGVGVADGDYLLRIETDGRYWQGARFRTEYPVRIVDGELAVTLPSVISLRALRNNNRIDVSWKVESIAGASAPADFGVWVGSIAGVDTSGSPVATNSWSGVGGYVAQLSDLPTTFFVAVRARLGLQVGPVSEVQVTTPNTTDDLLLPPTGVSGRIPDGDWSSTP